MRVDGERIRELVRNAGQEVVLCAPFVKADAFQKILSAVRESVCVRLITRWRAGEVAAGVSDLEVLDVADRRQRTEVFLLDALHAKLYVADDRCLVGSANLTNTGLGWAGRYANVEILVEVERGHPEVIALLEQVGTAKVATPEVREKVRKEADELVDSEFGEAEAMREDERGGTDWPWLPRCAAPARLFSIYQGREVSLAGGTVEDGREDLRDLGIAPGLTENQFTPSVRKMFIRMPALQTVMAEIPRGLSDQRGWEIVATMRPEYGQGQVRKQWEIIRDWMDVFLRDRYEVAAASFVIRLRRSGLVDTGNVTGR